MDKPGLDLACLVEVREIGDLVPEVGHDLGVLLVGLLAPLALALDDRVLDGEALEVVLVQEAVVVDVVHVAHHKLDAVLPGEGHD